MQGSKLIQEQPGLGVGWPRTSDGRIAPLVLPGGQVATLPTWRQDASGNVTGLSGPDGTSIPFSAVAAIPNVATSAQAAANTAAFNTALAAGGIVALDIPGTYWVAGTTNVPIGTSSYNVALRIPSNTTLRLGRGVIVKMLSGTVNPVLIQNSDITGGNVNITIEGPGELNGNATEVTRTDGTIFSCIAVWLQNITGLRLRGFKVVDAHAWAIGIANCRNVRTKDIGFDYTITRANQGGFQFQGANSDVVVEDTYGYTIDDAVAFVCVDYGVYASSMAGAGAADQITIRGVHADNLKGMLHHIRLQDSTANPLSNVFISNLTGPYTRGGCVIGAHVTGATTRLRNIQIDNIQVRPLSAAATEAVIEINGNVESLIVSNAQRFLSSTDIARPLIQLNSLSVVPVVGRLIVKGVTWLDDGNPSANIIAIDRLTGVLDAGQIIDLQVSDITASWTNINAAPAIVANNFASAVMGDVSISNVRTINGGRIFYNGGVVTNRVKLSNISRLNSRRALVRHNNASGAFPFLDLSNVSESGTGLTTDGGTILFSTAVSGACAIRASNFENLNGTVTLSNPGSASVSWDGLSLPGVETAALTNVLGNVIRDRADSAPKRVSTAPGTYTAL